MSLSVRSSQPSGLCTSAPRILGSGPIAALSAVLLSSTLVGCGMNGSPLAKATTASSASPFTISGSIHGGQQTVSGASIQLYTVGSTTPSATGVTPILSGYGTGATPLLTSPVTSDSNGNFSITGQYTCPTPSAPVYLVATGGNPGLTPTAPATTINNKNIAMMVAIGNCPAGGTLLPSVPFVVVNELSTVSAVWALQQFMAAPATTNTDAPNIGAPNTAYATGTSLGSVKTAAIGLANAFSTAHVMTDLGTGISPNLFVPYATPETAKINTIADILAFCINSDSTQSNNCSTLFADSTPAGKTTAADTIQAAWYIAQNPTNNLAALFNHITGTPPFQPYDSAPGTLTSGLPAGNAFNDATIAINYAPVTTSTTSSAGVISTSTSTSPAIAAAYGIAIDAYGNAWVANDGGIGGTVASAVELGTDGSALTSAYGAYTASASNGSTAQFTGTPTPTYRPSPRPKHWRLTLPIAPGSPTRTLQPLVQPAPR